MLTSVSYLNGSKIIATDNEIGHVKEAYFDDQAWTIRYLVVDTGAWLPGREVLVSPYSVIQPLGSGKMVDVSLTRAQVEASPPIEKHKPVSRQHEIEYFGYYGFPGYWDGTDLWGMTALPQLPPPLPVGVESASEIDRRQAKVSTRDAHLRSSAEVTGYEIQAADGSIGHVEDFVFDDESWRIRYLVVDTRNWWPGGKKVLLAAHWIDSIDWSDQTVHTMLTRDQVKSSPEYEEGEPINRDYEKRLHQAYGREGYWT